MEPVSTTDGRRLRGQRTREAVLDAAVMRAAIDGLAGLSLAQLAAEVGMSKSALFAHWPDKESLQLDTVGRASELWTQHVIQPAMRKPRGVRRVFALHESRLRFYRDGTEQGCRFFVAAKSDFDDRPGPIKDLLTTITKDWVGFIQSVLDDAVAAGDLAEDTDTAQLAFEIEALGEAVVTASRLIGVRSAYTHARRAVLNCSMVPPKSCIAAPTKPKHHTMKMATTAIIPITASRITEYRKSRPLMSRE